MVNFIRARFSYIKQIFLIVLFIQMFLLCAKVFSQEPEFTDRNLLNGDSEVTGVIYRDMNNNGNYDATIDILLEDIDIIVASSNFTISVDTDENGQWIVKNLPPGNISISVDLIVKAIIIKTNNTLNS